MNNYKIGDRIIMTKDYDFAKIGMIGTIRGYDENYAIEFDEGFPDGHHCCRLIKSRRGHWVAKDCFELYHEDKIEVGDKVEFTRTIGNIKKGFKGIVRGKIIDLSLFDVVLTDCGSCSDRGEIWCVPRSSIRLIEKHTKPIKQQNWNISIIPDGDKTTLSLTVDGEKNEYTVKRYEEDTYSIEAAVRALMDKAFKKETIEKKPVAKTQDLYLKLNNHQIFNDKIFNRIGFPVSWCDKYGEPLRVGDVIEMERGNFICKKFVVYNDLYNFVKGLIQLCNTKTGEIQTWKVKKIKDYSMAKIGDKVGDTEVVSE